MAKCLSFMLWEETKVPVFEYTCKKCGHIFEKLVLKKEEEEDIRCPKCNGMTKKVMSVPQEPILF